MCHVIYAHPQAHIHPRHEQHVASPAWTLYAHELQPCSQMLNQISILKDRPDPGPDISQFLRMAGWPEAIMQVACHQKGNQMG